MKNTNNDKKKLSPKQREALLKALKVRFEKNMKRHKGLEWTKVEAKLEAHVGKLWSLSEMERIMGSDPIPTSFHQPRLERIDTEDFSSVKKKVALDNGVRPHACPV